MRPSFPPDFLFQGKRWERFLRPPISDHITSRARYSLTKTETFKEVEIEEQTQSSISSVNDYFSSRAIPIPSGRSALLYGFFGAKTPKRLVG